MKHSRTSDFKVGDECITKWGDIVTVAKVTSRMIEIKENVENGRVLYIPAHGEIEKKKRVRMSKCCNYKVMFNHATGDWVCSGCRARV